MKKQYCNYCGKIGHQPVIALYPPINFCLEHFELYERLYVMELMKKPYLSSSEKDLREMGYFVKWCKKVDLLDGTLQMKIVGRFAPYPSGYTSRSIPQPYYEQWLLDREVFKDFSHDR